MANRRQSGALPPVRRKKPPRAPLKKKISRRVKKPDLHVMEILAWADEHHERTGKWPTRYSGDVSSAPWETWRCVDGCLRLGHRGCPGSGSLNLFLHRHRGTPVRVRRRPPRLTVRQILAWADAHHRRTKKWPSQSSGKVHGCPDENWRALDGILHKGGRGLPGGDSVAQILVRYRGVRRGKNRPRLTFKQILEWADKHHQRTGRWPSFGSGPVVGAPGERWAAIHSILEKGGRGLRTGYTLAKLLHKYRGIPYKKELPPYTERQILEWADAHLRRHGSWPTLNSGAISEAPGETWLKVEGALSKGRRGLPGGDSLSKLLIRCKRRPGHYRRHHAARQERLSVQRILAWADEFHSREGHWPARGSGRIEAAQDDTWESIDNALRMSLRGLREASSVALLLEKHRGARHKHHRPRITNRDILAWADAHFKRMGRWPSSTSGAIPESSGDTWCAVDNALRSGTRGRPGGDSITRFLDRHGRRR